MKKCLFQRFLPLLWCHSLPLFEGADQVTAVGKAGLLADIRQILVCEKQQIRRFVNAGKFNIFLAGLIVGFPEKLRKIRVTSAQAHVHEAALRSAAQYIWKWNRLRHRSHPAQ